MTSPHGTGLRVDGGDIVVRDGRLELVSGVTNLAQALQLRVLTPLGSDRYDVRYGLDTQAIFTSAGGASATGDLIRLNLVRTLGSDPRVGEIRDIRLTDQPGTGSRAWRVEVLITASDGTPSTLALELGAAA